MRCRGPRIRFVEDKALVSKRGHIFVCRRGEPPHALSYRLAPRLAPIAASSKQRPPF